MCQGIWIFWNKSSGDWSLHRNEYITDILFWPIIGWDAKTIPNYQIVSPPMDNIHHTELIEIQDSMSPAVSTSYWQNYQNTRQYVPRCGMAPPASPSPSPVTPLSSRAWPPSRASTTPPFVSISCWMWYQRTVMCKWLCGVHCFPKFSRVFWFAVLLVVRFPNCHECQLGFQYP